MKKIICLLLCICMLSLVVGCNNNDKNTFKTGVISENVQVNLIDDDNNYWLNNTHFEKISVKTNKDNTYYLELTTTKNGKEVLLKTTEKTKGKTLSFTANEVLLFTVTISEPIKNGILTYSGTTLDPIYAFNLLADVTNKTADLTPPENVISLEKAKDIALKKAETTSDSVTDLKANLKFDEDWRGWEYDITFKLGETKYEIEINALTGAIILYHFE